jgi:hypothetical protein
MLRWKPKLEKEEEEKVKLKSSEPGSKEKGDDKQEKLTLSGSF